jgi:hypothetical protein
MKRDPNIKYLTLDGMPFVTLPDGRNFVFSRVDQKWVPQDGADFDARFPNEQRWPTWFADTFADLPELPNA